MVEKAPMTPEGYQALKVELKRCKTEDRPRIIHDIETALDHGDLSENAEYDAAKEAQQQLDQKMKEIEDKLSRAQVIRPEDVKGDHVVFGARVVLTRLDNDAQVSYQIVGEDEASRAQKKISVLSPLARAMIGKSIGDLFVVQTPGGEQEYAVEEIHFG